MKRPLILLGACGNTSDALDVVDAINRVCESWQCLGVLDDAHPAGDNYREMELLGPLREAHAYPDACFLNAIGSDRSFRNREQLIQEIGLPPERYATLIHPAASVSRRAALGRGVLVNYGVSIAGGVQIGDHVLIGPGCIIGHDACIGDHTVLAPGAVVSGSVHIESAAYIGARSVIRQNQTIGRQALVGMGAVVTKDVAAGSTVIGCPAKQYNDIRKGPVKGVTIEDAIT